MCKANDTHYLLFILDSSGSIGSDDFSRVTEAIGNITAFFCDKVQVALMTFDNLFYLEFCFNCYDNDARGRSSLSQAIKNTPYRDGYTWSASAVKCACIDLLQESCGLPQDAECLDVVFITDGRSNDMYLDVCEEVQCLHSRSINTYAVGVGDINPDEIQCIHNSTEPGILTLDDVDDLVDTFEQAQYILSNPTNEQSYSCLSNVGRPVKT